jgi:hypothetical protein
VGSLEGKVLQEGPWRLTPYRDGGIVWFTLEHAEDGACGDVYLTDFPNVMRRIQSIAYIHVSGAKRLAKLMLDHGGQSWN